MTLLRGSSARRLHGCTGVATSLAAGDCAPCVARPSNRASRGSYSHPLSTRLVSSRPKGAHPVRLPEQEADDAIAEANHALEVSPTGQIDTASQIAAAQVRAIAALAGAVDRLAGVLDEHLPQIAGNLGPPR